MSDTLNPSGSPQVPPTAPQPPVSPASQDPQAFADATYAAGAVPPVNEVPPTAQTPPPYAPAPQNMPGMPLMYLTGGMKFGWAVAGFFMGPIAILLAWLTNAHNFPEAKNDAVKFSLFGFLATFLLWIVLLGMFGCAACAAVSSSTGYYYY